MEELLYYKCIHLAEFELYRRDQSFPDNREVAAYNNTTTLSHPQHQYRSSIDYANLNDQQMSSPQDATIGQDSRSLYYKEATTAKLSITSGPSPQGNRLSSDNQYSYLVSQSEPGLRFQSYPAQQMMSSNPSRKDIAEISSVQSRTSLNSLPPYSSSAPHTMYDQNFIQTQPISSQFSKTVTSSLRFAGDGRPAPDRSSFPKDPFKDSMTQSWYVSEPPEIIFEHSIEQELAADTLNNSQRLPAPSKAPAKRQSSLRKEKDTPSRNVAFEIAEDQQKKPNATSSKGQTPLKREKASTQTTPVTSQSKASMNRNNSATLSQNKVFQKISEKISRKQSTSSTLAQSYARNEESQRQRVDTTNQSFSQSQTAEKRVEKSNQSIYQERKKPVVAITKVNEALKKKILEWLFSITFLKDSAKDLEKKLPKICKNGVIFADLINRLEGKNDTIKGITRHPETKTQINVNYSKTFSYLRQQQKMNPRYLWAEEYLMEGNDDVFWGLLFDIWCFYSQKVSPYDPRYKESKSGGHDHSTSKMFRSEQSTMSAFQKDPYEESLYVSNKPKKLMVSPPRNNVSTMTQDYSAIYVKDSTMGSPTQTRRMSPKSSKSRQRLATEPNHDSDSKILSASKLMTEPRDNLRLASPKGSTKSQILNSSLSSRFFNAEKSGFQDEKPTDYVPIKASHENIITFDMQQDVEIWLEQIGLSSYLHRRDSSLFKDPFRNGVLLATVVGKIENEKLPAFYPHPETIEQCRKKIYSALELLRRKKTPIPYRFSKQEEAILQGDYNVTWGLLYSLMKISREKQHLETTYHSLLRSPSKSISQDFSGKILPYSEEEIRRLEMSILDWVIKLGLFGESHEVPLTFEELEVQLRNGALLCELIELVTQTKVVAYSKKPKNEAQIIGNIRRGLEVLRVNKNMSQKHTWKEKELHKGSKYYLLGLLEDLHRLFDGLPPRTDPNYYSDGPYYGENEEKYYSSARGNTQSPFGSFVEKRGLGTETIQNENSPSRSFINQTHQTADFAKIALKIQPDAPISLLDMNQSPINLVDYSSVPTSKVYDDASLSQSRTGFFQDSKSVAYSSNGFERNRYNNTEVKVNFNKLIFP